MVNYLSRPVRSGKLCVIYVRVSKGENVQQSMPGQFSMAMRRAQAMGYELATHVGHPLRDPEQGLVAPGGVFKDERPRGMRRPALEELLLVMADHDEIGAVFFWERQRFWGHLEQYRFLNRKAVESGYRLIDAHGMDMATEEMSQAISHYYMSVASEHETANVGRRAKEANSEKVEKYKILVGRPMLGIDAVPYINADGKRRTRQVVNTHDMAIVRRIFREYAEHKGGAFGITQRLVADEVRTSRQIQQGAPCQWTVVRIRNILDNPIYVGKQKYNQTGVHWELDPVTGDKIRRVRKRHPSQHISGESPLGVILAEDPNDPESVAAAEWLFDEVQSIRSANGRERPKKKYAGVLEGLVRCARCGRAMQYTNTGYTVRATGERRTAFSYICPRRTGSGSGCSAPHSIAEKKLHTELAGALAERADKGVSGDPMVTWKQRPNTSPKRREMKLAANDVESAKAAIKRLDVAYKDGVYDDDMDNYKSLRQAEKVKLVTAEATLAAAESPVETTSSTFELSGGAAETMRTLIEEITNEGTPFADRQGAARRVFDRILVDQPRMTVVLR